MKTLEGRGLTPEQVAFYQQLEKQRTACHPVLAAFGAITLWPALLFRFPRFFLVLLFAGLLMGAVNAWRTPMVQAGLLISPAALAMGLKTGKADGPVLSGFVLPRGR